MNNYCEQCSLQNIRSIFVRYSHKDSFSVRVLLTDKIHIGMTERGSLKNICKPCISSYSKDEHNIKMPFAYSEFTGHIQNQL